MYLPTYKTNHEKTIDFWENIFKIIFYTITMKKATID